MNVDAINNLLEEYYLFEEYTYTEIFLILVRFICELFFTKKYQQTQTNKRSYTPPKPVNYTEYCFAPACGKFDPEPVKFDTQYAFNTGEKHDIKRPKAKVKSHFKFTPNTNFNHKFHKNTYVPNFKNRPFRKPFSKFNYDSFTPPKYEYKPSYQYYHNDDYNKYNYRKKYYNYKPFESQHNYQSSYQQKSYKTDRQKAFEVLGLQENSDKNSIKQAYHKLALKWHPDKNKTSHAEIMFKKINEAYTLVKY
tara:strand:+ start:618 stop:1367 length:750 start_codon:yes stop_codon:yes gene_type:complete